MHTKCYGGNFIFFFLFEFATGSLIRFVNIVEIRNWIVNGDPYYVNFILFSSFFVSCCCELCAFAVARCYTVTTDVIVWNYASLFPFNANRSVQRVQFEPFAFERVGNWENLIKINSNACQSTSAINATHRHKNVDEIFIRSSSPLLSLSEVQVQPQHPACVALLHIRRQLNCIIAHDSQFSLFLTFAPEHWPDRRT